jgi:type II secretory pathway component PulF
MPALTNDDLTAFNDELAALVRAGLPLELGLGATPEEVAAALARVNAALNRRPGGEPAAWEVLKHLDPPLPAAYRGLIQIGLRTGDLHAALDTANRLAEFQSVSRFSMRSALFYPLTVCTLALAGALAFAIYVVPKLQRFSDDLQLPGGRGLAVASYLHDWRYALAALLAALIVWQIWRTVRRAAAARSNGALSRLSGAAWAVQQQQYATFAETMSVLTAAEVPLEEGLPIAAGACGDERLAAGNFPPFLQWAVLRSEPAVERSRALQMAADVYRESSKRTHDRAAIVAPVLAGVGLAGVAVLAYGLLLFAPLTELLYGLAMKW